MRGLFLCLVVGLVVSSCAARGPMTLPQSSLAAFQLSAAIDDAEQQSYAAGLYGEAKHLMFDDIVKRILVAARGYDQAVSGATDQPVGNARDTLVLALDDLEIVIKGVPKLEVAVKALRALVGS